MQSEIDLIDLDNALKRIGWLLLDLRERKGGLIHEFHGTQAKAKADLQAHHVLKQELKKIADVPVVSEEDHESYTLAQEEIHWLIDPIDGTASFVEGYTGFVTQAAYMVNGIPMVAGVHAPALGKTYLAKRESGVTLNGNLLPKINGSKTKILVDNYPEPRGITKGLFASLPFSDYIECGSLGLKSCLVAEGVADVFFKDVALKSWDIAPAMLVFDEMGGWYSDTHGERFNLREKLHHHGVVATQSHQVASKVLQWYQNQSSRE